MDRFRICSLCFRSPFNQRILPECGHAFCLTCIARYYDDRQRTSVMRIGALPCPVRTCRVLSPVPPGGVAEFALDSETIMDEKPEVDQTDVTRRHSGSKKRVTFSDDKEETDNRNSEQDTGSDPVPVSKTPPRFRSIVKVSLGGILPQTEVDIPDSALILDPVTPAPPDIWTGSEDQGFSRKKLGESVFVFPSVVSIDNEDETENDVSANENRNKNDDGERTRIDIIDGPVYLDAASPQQVNGMRMGSTTDREEEEEGTPDEMSKETDLLWRIESRADQKPTSIALTEDDRGIVANYGLGNLEQVDENGVTTLTSEKLKPFSVILADVSGFQSISGCIVCADRRQKTVLFIDPETGELVTQWEPGFFAWVGGLGVLRNGNIVVSDRVHCCVGVYTPDGARITEFGSYGAGDHNICMADYLAVDSRDRIVISDSANHCVKVFDESGRFLAKISGGRGADDGLLSWPKGVCVTPADNIVVADSQNGRISMFSPSGDFIRHLVSDIPCPYGVTYGGRKRNTIAVTHYALSGYSQCDAYRLKTPI